MRKRNALRYVFAVLLLIVAVGLFAYPVIANYVFEHRADSIVETVEASDVDETDPAVQEQIQQAQAYNEVIAGGHVQLTDPFMEEQLDEEAGEYWKSATAPEIFTCKYPFTTGKFYKTIICGHFRSSFVAGDEGYLGRVYFDQASHYFIDGYVNKSGKVPVLVYDTQSKQYTSFEKIADTWHEYRLNERAN